MLGIGSAYALDSTHVHVQFSGAVTPASATNPANYAVSRGMTISSVTLGADNQTAILTMSPGSLDRLVARAYFASDRLPSGRQSVEVADDLLELLSSRR